MVKVTKIDFKYPTQYTLDGYLDKHKDIEEPTLSILKAIAEYRESKKNNPNGATLVGTFKDDKETHGFYKFEQYSVLVDGKAYQTKIDIDCQGSNSTKVQITSITFDLG